MTAISCHRLPGNSPGKQLHALANHGDVEHMGGVAVILDIAQSGLAVYCTSLIVLLCNPRTGLGRHMGVQALLVLCSSIAAETASAYVAGIGPLPVQGVLPAGLYVE